jgi:hypothetical protein
VEKLLFLLYTTKKTIRKIRTGKITAINDKV